MEKIIKVEGMMCANCEKHVGKALESLGVHAEVSHEKGTAIVTGSQIPEDSRLRKAVQDAGYEVVAIEEK